MKLLACLSLLNVKSHIRGLNDNDMSAPTFKYVLLLGSNLGNRISNLLQAADSIINQIGAVEKISKVYGSQPWGFISDDSFVNQAIVVSTSSSPQQVMKSIQSIESSMGRTRDSSQGYTSRIIDIDILHWDGGKYSSEDLQIPHLLLGQRRFALMPLVEVLPTGIHPESNLTYTELLCNCKDFSDVIVINDL